MKNYIKISLSVLCLLSFFLSACQSADKKIKSPENFDFGKPEKFSMAGSLLEISGICFYKGNSDTIYAIQDEDGKLFHMAWGSKKNIVTKFGKKGDYEDVAIVNDKVFVLRSDGTIFSFAKTLASQEEVNSVTEWNDLLPIGEYEGIYGDADEDKLYVICKDCKTNDNEKVISGFILDTKSPMLLSSGFSIDVTSITSLTKKMRSGFRPSALAKNPVTGDWFILSGSNKLLAIADTVWKVKNVYNLNGNLFNQSEGMAFDVEGNLYISNEGDDWANGNILLFKRKQTP